MQTTTEAGRYRSWEIECSQTPDEAEPSPDFPSPLVVSYRTPSPIHKERGYHDSSNLIKLRHKIHNAWRLSLQFRVQGLRAPGHAELRLGAFCS